MLLSRQEIKAMAKERFAQNRSQCIYVCLVLTVLVAIFTEMTLIGTVFLSPAFIITAQYFFHQVYQGEYGTLSSYLKNCFDNLLRKVGAHFLSSLLILLASILLFVPGVILSMAFYGVPYIVAMHPEVTVTSALKLSMRITKGYRMDLFITYLSFIGWLLLSGLTFGILYVVYVGPYMSTTFGGIYAQLEQEALDSGVITKAQLEGDVVF